MRGTLASVWRSPPPSWVPLYLWSFRIVRFPPFSPATSTPIKRPTYRRAIVSDPQGWALNLAICRINVTLCPAIVLWALIWAAVCQGLGQPDLPPPNPLGGGGGGGGCFEKKPGGTWMPRTASWRPNGARNETGHVGIFIVVHLYYFTQSWKKISDEI